MQRICSKELSQRKKSGENEEREIKQEMEVSLASIYRRFMKEAVVVFLLEIKVKIFWVPFTEEKSVSADEGGGVLYC